MNGKTCVITGSTSGIGKYTAIGLAALGARVVIMGRTQSTLDQVKEEIKSESGNDDIYAHVVDLASLSSVRSLAETIKESYPCVDVLINNAGTFHSDYTLSNDNIEMQFAVNHLSHFLLTNLLLEHIKKSDQGRVINVSSGFHYLGRIHFKDVNLSRNYNGLFAYAQSKVANVLFTNELARKLEGSNATANSLHPGRIRTNMGNKYAKGIFRLGWLAAKPFLHTEEQGAQTSIYLASSPDVENITGKYHVNSKQRRSSRHSRNEDIANRLWRLSAEMVGLDSRMNIPH